MAEVQKEFLDAEGLAYFTEGVKKLIEEAEPDAITEERIEELLDSTVGESSSGVAQSLTLTDRVTGTKHTLHVSNGKLIMESEE